MYDLATAAVDRYERYLDIEEPLTALQRLNLHYQWIVDMDTPLATFGADMIIADEYDAAFGLWPARVLEVVS